MTRPAIHLTHQVPRGTFAGELAHVNVIPAVVAAMLCGDFVPRKIRRRPAVLKRLKKNASKHLKQKNHREGNTIPQRKFIENVITHDTCIGISSAVFRVNQKI